MNSQKPLVIHDLFLFPGGGERVALELASAFGADLWTGQWEPGAFPQDYFASSKVVDLNALQRSPLWLRFSKIAQLWWGFSHVPFQSRPWTLFSGSLSLLASARIGGPKALYCHTPPRLLYDLRTHYLHQVHPTALPVFLILLALYRKAYEKAVRSMDLVVANSLNVKKRLKHYLNKDAEVVYPPCDTRGFRWLGQEDYYLSTARLDPLKRVDSIVNAFLKMPHKKLVVASGGCQYDAIRQMASQASNIHVLGWLDEESLRDLVGRCIATLYIPRDEDFGISPVESMAAGKPVIGVAEGGLLETISDGETGTLIPAPPRETDICRAVEAMTPECAKAMRSSCESRASLFHREVFTASIERLLNRLTSQSRMS